MKLLLVALLLLLLLLLVSCIVPRKLVSEKLLRINYIKADAFVFNLIPMRRSYSLVLLHLPLPWSLVAFELLAKFSHDMLFP